MGQAQLHRLLKVKAVPESAPFSCKIAFYAEVAVHVEEKIGSITYDDESDIRWIFLPLQKIANLDSMMLYQKLQVPNIFHPH
ncbi:MAG: hypothetical protein U0I22_00995 [Treponema sp.]|nr:hypothetical protein [Treponema sp.]